MTASAGGSKLLRREDPMHVYVRGNIQQRLRLGSGLILFAFALAHFSNHAIGLWSLEAMHEVQAMRTAVTRSWPGTLILAAALATHMTLGFLRVARRRTLKMPKWEAVQVGFGLAIPFLLLPHIVNTRVAHAVFGVDDIYLYELVKLWPDSAVLQSTLLLLVWIHGCIGIHYWLRLTERYRRIAPALLVFAVGLPLLALGGFVNAGTTTADIMSDPMTFAEFKERVHWPDDGDSNTLANLRDAVRLTLALLVGGLAVVLYLRHRKRAAAEPARIIYLGGPVVPIREGMTLLEISRSAGVPHASVCGGRARCSTCRVRIETGLEKLPAPTGAEAATLQAIEAPPNVRLACQIRPTASLTVAAVSAPAVPGPIEAEFVEIKEVVAAHVRAVLAGQLADIATADGDEITRWFRGRVPYAVLVPQAEPHGFGLQGARVDYLRDRPVAALVYRSGPHAVSLFVMPATDGAALALRGPRNGYNVNAWVDAGHAYFAVSDMASAGLDRLEELMTRAEAA